MYPGGWVIWFVDCLARRVMRGAQERDDQSSQGDCDITRHDDPPTPIHPFLELSE